MTMTRTRRAYREPCSGKVADQALACLLAPHRQEIQDVAVKAAEAAVGSLQAMHPFMLDLVESGRAQTDLTAKARRNLLASFQESLSRGLVAEDLRLRTEAAITCLDRKHTAAGCK